MVSCQWFVLLLMHTNFLKPGSVVRRRVLDVGCRMLDVSDVLRHLLSPNFHLPSTILLLLALLGGTTAAMAQTLPAKKTSSSATSAFTNAPSTTPPALSGYVADDKYKLRAGDKVSLQILEDRDLPKSLVVTDSGELDAPYIGRVSVADKTCKQLAGELKAQLEKEYYYRATVVIALDAAN